MLMRIMKWVSIAALLLSFAWSSSTPNQDWSAGVGGYLELLVIVVFVTSILVVTQAARAGKYFWAAGFLPIAVLFNPVVPIALSRGVFLWLDWVCIAAFLLSLAAVKRQPVLSMQSIANRTPGSESL